MNPISKMMLIAALAASLITLAAQSVGGDLAALIAALAAAPLAALIVPRLFGVYVVSVDRKDLEDLEKHDRPESASLKLMIESAKTGRKATKAETLAAMDQDIADTVKRFEEVEKRGTQEQIAQFAANLRVMRSMREEIANKMED